MITVRRFESRDAESVAELIATAMRTSNAADYPPEVLEPLIAYFSPVRLVALSAERYMLVAERAGAVVGTAALENDSIETCFVRPDLQRQGIGRQLVNALEERARAAGITALSVASSLTAVPFYESAGYRRTGGELHGSGGRQLPMVKRLVSGSSSMRVAPALLFVTGASGAGKTTVVRALEARSLPGVRCFYFDSVGVPSPADMIRDYGSGEAWQAAMTAHWVRRLVADPAEVCILDGQARPSVIRAAVADAGASLSQIVLLDCSAEERARRLAGPRSQPELASPQMSAWAAYLRGQADALELPVVDTTGKPVADVADALLGEVERLRNPRDRTV